MLFVSGVVIYLSEPSHVGVSQGLHLKVDADVLQRDLTTVGNAYHREHGSGGPRCHREVRSGWAYHVLRGMGRICQEGSGASLPRIWTDDRVYRITDDRPGEDVP